MTFTKALETLVARPDFKTTRLDREVCFTFGGKAVGLSELRREAEEYTGDWEVEGETLVAADGRKATACDFTLALDCNEDGDPIPDYM